MPSHARVRRAVLAAGLCLLIVGLWADGAGAHAIVKETVPAIDSTVPSAPEQVVMTFNEPVELAFGAIRVYDSNRDRVDDGDARHEGGVDTVAVDLEDDLPDGTYTVTWRVVSADGHPIHEAFVFHVGSPGARPEGIASELLGGEGGAGRLEGALAGVARWVTFASLLVLFGVVAFALAVWPGRELRGEGEQAFRRWWRRLAAGSAVGVVVGTAAAFLLQGAVAGDLGLGDAMSFDVLEEVAGTRFGQVAVARLALVVVLAAVLWSQRLRLPGVSRTSVGSASRIDRLPLSVVVGVAVLGVGMASTPGVAGHAGTTSPVALNVLADTVHVVAAGVWLGGLALLLVGVLPSARRHHPDAVDAAPLVARYSDVALVAIAAVVASGLVRSWVEVRSLGALDETYGLVLLAKVGVFVPIVVAGYVNNRILKPKLNADAASAWRTLRRTVTAEVVLAAAVLGLTALLVNLAPARVSAGTEGPFVTNVHVGAYHLNLIVDPNEVGENQIHLTATTATGAPAPAEAMTVLFRMPDQDIGPLVADGTQLAPGHFVVQGRQLSVAGRWTLEIVVRTGRFDEERTQISLIVN